MQRALRQYHSFLSDPACVMSLLQGTIFFAISATAVFHAVSYATVHASNHVTDIVLSNIHPMNVRFLFVYGTFAQFAFLIAILLARPTRLPFALKAIALFLIIRAGFISLTHLAPYPIDPQKPAPFLNSVFYGGDLFFSGHTGLPFLGALVFWHIKELRWFYLASTLFFGVVVLLGHYHYSIDVFAALFITYGIFHLSRWLFPRDYASFRASGDPREASGALEAQDALTERCNPPADAAAQDLDHPMPKKRPNPAVKAITP